MIEIIKDHTKNVDNLIGNYAYVTNSGVSINSNESCDIYDSFFLDDINDKNIVPKELNEIVLYSTVQLLMTILIENH